MPHDLIIIDDPACPDMDDPETQARVAEWYGKVIRELPENSFCCRSMPFHEDALVGALIDGL
jgi:hypothetical protein